MMCQNWSPGLETRYGYQIQYGELENKGKNWKLRD